MAGGIPIYLQCALKVTHHFRKRRFRQISLNSAAVVKASDKLQLSLTRSRQCAFHRAIDEACALPLSLPKQKVAQSENYYPRGASDRG